MENSPYPILEYDPSREAILEPSKLVPPSGIPPAVILCFFQDEIHKLLLDGKIHQIDYIHSEMGDHPIYDLEFNGRHLSLAHPGVGAPLSVGMLEEVIAKGGRYFIACGGAGVLDREIAVGHLMVPTSAVRDEGTSYHYLAPSREVEASLRGVTAIQRTLEHHKVAYLLTKTWTTDAFYRETNERTVRRKAEGCLSVEMEAAAFFAVAKFRGVDFAQILYGGDAVIPGEWDGREWNRQSVREQMIWLSAEACLELSDGLDE